MWKTVRACERFAVRFKDASNWKRTFLSNEYRCDEAWKSRLASPLLEKVDLENLYLTLNQKYNQIGKAHAIDVDIFANAIREGGHELDELSDLLYKLRLSTETTNTLESTHYAVVRCFLEAEKVEDLLDILHDKLNYGIFPDNPALNILMDALIKKKDYTSAARVAVLPMLQEDVENPITNTLAIYACQMYLKNPDGWKEPEPVVDESKEEIKVRVKFLRNPYFDDHFELQKPAHLVGKTLYFYGKYIGESLGTTYQLLGLTLYEKYGAAAGLIKEWMRNGVEQVLYKEGLESVKSQLSKIPENEITEDIRAFNKEIESLEKADLIEGSLDEAMENRVKEAVGLQAEKDIASQCQAFIDWESRRQAVLEEQMADLERQKRLANIKAMKKDLESREQVLTFFENEDKINLMIDSKKPRYKKKWFGKKKKPRVIDENYVPPEVYSRANNKAP